MVPTRTYFGEHGYVCHDHCFNDDSYSSPQINAWEGKRWISPEQALDFSALGRIVEINAWEGKRWIPQRWGELLRSVAYDFANRGIQDLVLIGAPGEDEQIAGLCNSRKKKCGVTKWVG